MQHSTALLLAAILYGSTAPDVTRELIQQCPETVCRFLTKIAFRWLLYRVEKVPKSISAGGSPWPVRRGSVPAPQELHPLGPAGLAASIPTP